MESQMSRISQEHRRSFIGGSDARIIMGDDEAALLRLWREKRGEVEPEDLSANLIVQLGRVTEDLNRLWYERNTGPHRANDARRQRAFALQCHTLRPHRRNHHCCTRGYRRLP